VAFRVLKGKEQVNTEELRKEIKEKGVNKVIQ